MPERENRLAKIEDVNLKSKNKREITSYDDSKLQINYKDHGRFIKVYNEPVNLPGKKILSDRNIKIEMTKGTREYLIDEGFDPIYGARPLKRAIQRYMENPIAEDLLKISNEYGISSRTSISECDKFFKELANESSSYKEKFKVIILPKEPPVESSLYTKLSQKPWTTIGKLWGNLASVGSSVALSLLNYKKELKKRKDLQLYQVKLKNPRNIADQIQLDNLNIELENINGDEENNND